VNGFADVTKVVMACLICQHSSYLHSVLTIVQSVRSQGLSCTNYESYRLVQGGHFCLTVPVVHKLVLALPSLLMRYSIFYIIAAKLFALMQMVRSMVLLFPFICSSPHRSGLHVTLQAAEDMHNRLSIGHGNLDAICT